MSDVTDVDAQRLLRHDVAAVRLPRDVVRATGKDAVEYLQGQLSQDLAALEPGGVAHSLVLEPTGKVDAWVRVWRPAGSDDGAPELLLEVDSGAGPGLLTRLERFKLRVEVDLELVAWHLVAVRGPATPAPEQLAGPSVLAAAVDWAGLRGVDLLGPDVEVPDGISEVGAAALDAVRVEAGWPAMATELGPDQEPKVIPAEAGEWLVERSVSFTKGCYTGQELVARVDSRGSRTPRKLRGLVVDGDDGPEVGATVVVDGEGRGQVTSVARSAELGRPVALAYVHRSVEPGATVRLGDGGPTATVRELPLVGG